MSRKKKTPAAPAADVITPTGGTLKDDLVPVKLPGLVREKDAVPPPAERRHQPFTPTAPASRSH